MFINAGDEKSQVSVQAEYLGLQALMPVKCWILGLAKVVGNAMVVEVQERSFVPA